MLIKRLRLICLFMWCAIAGMAQTLSYIFQFTASGLNGTPATATTPFQGQTFSNAAITIVGVANTSKPSASPLCSQPCYDNNSISVSFLELARFKPQHHSHPPLRYPIMFVSIQSKVFEIT